MIEVRVMTLFLISVSLYLAGMVSMLFIIAHGVRHR
jgi:hypothetical protein